MPGQFLSETQRFRLNRFPSSFNAEDLNKHFLLTLRDIEQVHSMRGPENQLGFALQLCTLRYLGYCPDDLSLGQVGSEVMVYLARQLRLDPASFADYGKRAHTRTDHLHKAQLYLGYREVKEDDFKKLEEWLLNRALEHEEPGLLLRQLLDHLHQQKLVRPGVTILERLIIRVKGQARQCLFEELAPLLTAERRQFLDSLLVKEQGKGKNTQTGNGKDKDKSADKETGSTSNEKQKDKPLKDKTSKLKVSRLEWLRQEAVSYTPNAILTQLSKLKYLHEHKVGEWDLTCINPNRRKTLAALAKRTSVQALAAMSEERRYPLVICLVYSSLAELTDQTVELFDSYLAGAYNRAGRELDEFRRQAAKATNEKLHQFRDLGRIVLDEKVKAEILRQAIFEWLPQAQFLAAVEECDALARPLDDTYFDFLAKNYSTIRQFAPKFLESMVFHSNVASAPLLEGVELLKKLNTQNRAKVPANAPQAFIGSRWRPYVFESKTNRKGKTKKKINRRYYELCVLWELRQALRAGNIWIEGSVRYAKLDSYLMSEPNWHKEQLEVYELLNLPRDATVRLNERAQELTKLMGEVENLLGQEDAAIHIEEGKLKVEQLDELELPASVTRLQNLIAQRLPHVELPELLVEVDRWTGFSRQLVHAGSGEPLDEDQKELLYAAILAQSSNVGIVNMARMIATSSAMEGKRHKLSWISNWYLREETLQEAVNVVVNRQYTQPLAQYWGDGTLSSSDGQRFPVTVKTRNARSLPKYFGYGKGLTIYSWSSDQASQFGTKVVPPTMRDATFVLDAILDNETDLPLIEHATDTAGYSEILFALFDLLGLQFSPRIRDLGDQQLYRLESASAYPKLKEIMERTVKQSRLVESWDELARLVGSLKLGYVPASLLISKLQSFPRQNSLTQVLQEYGRICKSIFILRYASDQEYRRRIEVQLNKGENLHALRQHLLYGYHGKLRKRKMEAQTNQANCLNLVTNAVVLWNTVYMEAAIAQLRSEGHVISESDLAHISPSRFEHLNVYGKYYFKLEENWHRAGLRALRNPAVGNEEEEMEIA